MAARVVCVIRRYFESAVAAPQATMMGAPLFLILWRSPGRIFIIYVPITRLWTATSGRLYGDVPGIPEQNNLLPREKLNADDWERMTLGVASGGLDRAGTTRILRGLLQKRKKK